MMTIVWATATMMPGAVRAPTLVALVTLKNRGAVETYQTNITAANKSMALIPSRTLNSGVATNLLTHPKLETLDPEGFSVIFVLLSYLATASLMRSSWDA
jgi:hypothetical protein